MSNEMTSGILATSSAETSVDENRGARHLHVACALIERQGEILAAQRSSTTTLPLKWEFPGGKIEAGESPEECLIREIQEELGICISISAALSTTIHNYPDFTVTLYPFTCRLASGIITKHEHNALLWIKPQQMVELDWAAADIPIIDEYLLIQSKRPPL